MNPAKKGKILPQRRRGAEKFRREIRFYPCSSVFICGWLGFLQWSQE